MQQARAPAGRGGLVTLTDRLDRWFAPVWAAPWQVARVLWAVSQAYAHALRFGRIGDVYGATDMIYTSPLSSLNEYVKWSYTTASAWWLLGAVGLGCTFAGGRAGKPGVVMYLLGAWALLLEEALNIKAHDRLALWVAFGLLLGPLAERGTRAYRSPVGRWYLLVVYCAIYGSTGLLKAIHEPGWFDGTVLPAHLTLVNFSGSPLALWVARQWWFVFVGGWWTVLFELAFPLLIWFRRTNPWLLLVAAVFHLAVVALMDVGAFSYISISMYPVLLHPEVAERWWTTLRARWSPAPGGGSSP